MILGALVIIVVGVLVINYFRGLDTEGTLPPVNTEETTNSTELPTTHAVAPGENLWTIAEVYYGNGEQWVEIAQANDLTSPGNIEEGQELTIPALETDSDLADASMDSEEGDEAIFSTEPTEAPEPTQTPVPTATPEPEPTEVPEPTSTPVPTETVEESNIADASMMSDETSEEESDMMMSESDESTDSQEDNSTDTVEGDTYTVVRGDSLWSIAQRAYGDGNKWVEIAEANDLANPSIIHAGNVFTLPR